MRDLEDRTEAHGGKIRGILKNTKKMLEWGGVIEKEGQEVKRRGIECRKNKNRREGRGILRNM